MRIYVVAGLILENSKILIGCRKKGDFEGFWEFPGGKVESGESDIQCLKREIKEELDVDIIVGAFFMSITHTYVKYTAEIRFYFASIAQGKFNLKVHSEVKFVKPDQLKKFKMLPSNLKTLKKLQKIKFT